MRIHTSLLQLLCVRNAREGNVDNTNQNGKKEQKEWYEPTLVRFERFHLAYIYSTMHGV